VGVSAKKKNTECHTIVGTTQDRKEWEAPGKNLGVPQRFGRGHERRDLQSTGSRVRRRRRPRGGKKLKEERSRGVGAGQCRSKSVKKISLRKTFIWLRGILVPSGRGKENHPKGEDCFVKRPGAKRLTMIQANPARGNEKKRLRSPSEKASSSAESYGLEEVTLTKGGKGVP